MLLFINTTIMTLNQIVEHFINHPSYLETGAPKLSKQFNVSLELINEAKQQVRNILKKEVNNQVKQPDTTITDNISLKDFGKMIGIDMDSNPEEDYPTTDNQFIIKNENESQWEEKSKWVKTKDQSTFLVKKSPDIDYKKEFELFLREFNPKENITTKPSFKYNSALLVYTSDKHIGAETKEGALFDNEWNKEKFVERMSLLVGEIIRLNELYKFETILVFDLGDALDGFNKQTTRGGHTLPQNMSNREAYSTFIEVHTDFFYTLSQYYNGKIAYISTGDSNHGGDYEWICNKSLESILNIRFPQIQTYIADKFIEHFELGNHCFIVCHGKDSEDLKFALPQVLNEKTELHFKKYIDQHNIKSKFIHVIKGDCHIASCQWGEFFRYKNVLSMYGASKWIQTNFMVNTKGVSMDILSNGSISEHQLFF